MVKINENYLLLQNSYLFVEVNRRAAKYMEENPDKDVIKMGIGDVTKPLVPTVINAFKDAVDEMAEADTFMGYGPEQGYDFLAEAIIKNDFNKYGVDLDLDEVFISDGAKCDTGNIQEIFSLDNVIAVTDPVYPVYVDTNVMAGRSGKIKDDGMYENIVYLPCTEENNFVPELPSEPVDLIYLCFPNNPTGTTLTKDELAKFVEYAKENDALILFDAAYEVFITEDDVPHTIYEIDGAKEVAMIKLSTHYGTEDKPLNSTEFPILFKKLLKQFTLKKVKRKLWQTLNITWKMQESFVKVCLILD